MHGNAHDDFATVWLFTGQGAQYYQMGRRLYDTNHTFRIWMDRLDETAADFTGHSVVRLMYDDARSSSEPFETLTETHPALFMVQYAMAQTLLAEGFAPPDVLLGASLGEFVAAAVAGVVDPETMLFDLIRQAYLFDAHCAGGAMLMVIDDVERFEADAVYAGCELAGVNFARCFVIAGLRARVHVVAEQLRQREIGCQLLPVRVAFHSSAIDAVRGHCEQAWARRAFAHGTVPIVSCATAGEDGANGARFSAAHGWNVVRAPIRFSATLSTVADTRRPAAYLDIGPAGNLATFARYLLPRREHDKVIAIMSPYGGGDTRLADARARARRRVNAPDPA